MGLSVLAPFMIHETFPTVTETASGSHPSCVVSVTYAKAQCFHGVNAGSNPAGDARFLNKLQEPKFLTRYCDPEAKRYCPESPRDCSGVKDDEFEGHKHIKP